MDQSQKEIIPHDETEMIKIEPQSENDIAEEHYMPPDQLQNVSGVQKSDNVIVPHIQKRKMPYISFEQIQRLEEQYYSELKLRQNTEEGKNDNQSAGLFTWTSQISCFTVNQKTNPLEDGIIEINSKEKMINIPVLPHANESILQIQFKLKRGEQLEIKNVGEDRQTMMKLIFNIFHTGYGLKLRVIVPIKAKTMKVWKEIQMPIKYNENQNLIFTLKQNLQGKLFASLNGIQFGVSLKMPPVSSYYFHLTGGLVEKITLEQLPIDVKSQYGKCQTYCSIF